MIPRLIIFDMDGTLVDSMPQLRQLAIAMIVHYYRIPDRMAASEYDRTVGKPFREQLNEIFGHDDARNSVAANTYETEHIMLAPSFPLGEHTVPVLLKLKAVGIKTALVSSTHKVIVRMMKQVQDLPITHVFGYTQGMDKDAQIAKACLYAGHVRSTETLYIGDSASDGLLAENIGIPFQLADVHTMGVVMDAIHATWRARGYVS